LLVKLHLFPAPKYNKLKLIKYLKKMLKQLESRTLCEKEIYFVHSGLKIAWLWTSFWVYHFFVLWDGGSFPRGAFPSWGSWTTSFGWEWLEWRRWHDYLYWSFRAIRLEIRNTMHKSEASSSGDLYAHILHQYQISTYIHTVKYNLIIWTFNTQKWRVNNLQQWQAYKFTNGPTTEDVIYNYFLHRKPLCFTQTKQKPSNSHSTAFRKVTIMVQYHTTKTGLHSDALQSIGKERCYTTMQGAHNLAEIFQRGKSLFETEIFAFPGRRISRIKPEQRSSKFPGTLGVLD